MRTKLLVGSLVVAGATIAVALGACSGDSTTTGGGTGASAPGTTSTQAANAGGTAGKGGAGGIGGAPSDTTSGHGPTVGPGAGPGAGHGASTSGW